jgi:hypothetical protein
VQTGLPIKQGDIAINDVPLNNIPNSQTVSHRIAIAKLQEFLEATATRCHVVSAGVYITPIANGLFETIDVVRSHTFRVCQYLRDTLWYRYFIDTQVWVWGDHGTTRKIDTFPRQITTESTLFTLQTLHKAPHWLLTSL